MSVRAAKFADIPQLACLLAEAHQRSIYAERAKFDPVEAKRLFAQAINRHERAGFLVLVSEKDGVVEGFMLALLDNVYPCLDALRATDLIFVVSERADARDAAEMLRQLDAWGEGNPKVIEVHLGVTSAIGDWERTAKLYERLGYVRCGAMLEKRVER